MAKKNLHLIHGLHLFQNLPFRQSIRVCGNAYKVNRYYRGGSHLLHKVKGEWPWNLVKRICKAFEGKNWNDAFTHYCSFVPWYQQYLFMEEFESKTIWRHVNWKDYDWYGWYIDKDKNIQYKKYSRDTSITFYSIDHESEAVYAPIPRNQHHIYHDRWNRQGEFLGYRTIKGFSKNFTSSNDHRYRKLSKEKRDQQRKQDREYKQYQQEKAYNFLTTQEQEEKEQRVLDLIKRDRKGFDKDSFKGMEYHGQKRKLKTWNH